MPRIPVACLLGAFLAQTALMIITAGLLHCAGRVSLQNSLGISLVQLGPGIACFGVDGALIWLSN